jgi:hypothetical protein
MKPVMKYLVVWIVTLVLAVQVILVLYYVKPELFSVMNPPAAVAAPVSVKRADSLVAPVDTIRVEQKDSAISESPSPVIVTASDDSLKALSAKLEAEMRKEASLEKKLATQNAAADSTHAKEIKGKAKLIELMSPEDAAKLLQNLKLAEAKQVLMAVKKKQAGKILSAMEPRIAARMMR